MADTTASFFESLGERGHEPLLDKASGTLRFELSEGGETARWSVSVDKGAVSVSRARKKADCVIRAEKWLFDGIAAGEVNATAAVLRGAIEVEGNPQLLVLFQRILPGPPTGSRARR